MIAQAVRVEARISFLQAAEREAENGQKLSTVRAFNTAMLELRRINVEIFRGAAKVDATVPVAIAAAASLDDADEAWREFIWRGERLGMTDDSPEFAARLDRYKRRDAELRARYGPPAMQALLHRTRAEQIWTERLLDEFRPRCIPTHRVNEMYKALGFVAGPFDPRSWRHDNGGEDA